jgi:pre-mRNA-splicing factor CWC22
VKRCVLQFKKSYRRNDKATCLSTTTFIAHLVNQRMVRLSNAEVETRLDRYAHSFLLLQLHEVVALQILMLLVDSPTDDSVEIAISFLKECGEKLTEVSSKGVNAIFDTLRYILHDNKVDKRVSSKCLKIPLMCWERSCMVMFLETCASGTIYDRSNIPSSQR